MKGLQNFHAGLQPITGLFHTIQKGPLIAVGITGLLTGIFGLFNFLANLNKNEPGTWDSQDNEWGKDEGGEDYSPLKQTFSHNKKSLALSIVGGAISLLTLLATKFNNDKALVILNICSVMGIILLIGMIITGILRTKRIDNLTLDRQSSINSDISL